MLEHINQALKIKKIYIIGDVKKSFLRYQKWLKRV